MNFARPTLLALLVAVVVTGCGRGKSTATSATTAPGGGGTVVLYTSVDEPYVKPLTDQFEKETGIHVDLVTDGEASKSVGLAERLLAEKANPKADVWWDNEVFRTVTLADAGVLAAYDSPSAADIPARYRDAAHRWAGSILRVRVIVAVPTVTPPPTKLGDLLRPDLKGRVALARPTAGTTGGQVAALYSVLGSDPADAFFRKLHANGAKLLGGNSDVAEAVARGTMLVGLCDNDDAASVTAEVGPVAMTLPGQAEDEPGTLAMPCAVALVDGAPHAAQAKRLIDALLSAKTDQAMLTAKFAWCSVRSTDRKGKFMDVDYEKVAKAMPADVRRAAAILDGR